MDVITFNSGALLIGTVGAERKKSITIDGKHGPVLVPHAFIALVQKEEEDND